MMNKPYTNFLKFTAIVLILLINAPSVNGQYYNEAGKRLFDNVTLNANVGLNLFYGDIQVENELPYQEDYKLAFGLRLRKQVSPLFSFGLQILNGQAHGTKPTLADGTEVNYQFEADIL